MKRVITALFVVASILGSASALAEPEYVTIEMEIDVDKPAAEAWEKVGGYCGISEWLGIDCTMTSGDGDIGSVRALAGGRIIEVLTAKTDLSYGYTQPSVDGQFYNLYHGFLEAKPASDSTSKMVYTLMYDVSNLADQAAKDADVAGRRAMFTNALGNIKKLAEE